MYGEPFRCRSLVTVEIILDIVLDIKWSISVCIRKKTLWIYTWKFYFDSKCNNEHIDSYILICYYIYSFMKFLYTRNNTISSPKSISPKIFMLLPALDLAPPTSTISLNIMLYIMIIDVDLNEHAFWKP